MKANRARILAIDDTPANLFTLGTALESDYELQFATSGMAGLALAMAHPPDLILLDVMMPEVDGYETFRRFAAEPTLKDVPVVFVTALDNLDAEIAGLKLGAVDYITKPIKVMIARQRIHNLLEREHLRKVVQAQRDQLRKLSVAVEQCSAAITITDRHARLEYVNPCFTQVTGYSATESVGKNPRFLQSGHTSKATYADMWNTLTNDQVWQGELCNRRKNGELYWEESHIAPIKDADGNTTHYVALKTDISDRKRTEDQLRLAASVFTHCHEGIMIADADGLIVDVNQAFSRITGYSREEVLGRNPRILKSEHHDTAFYADLWRDLSINNFWSGEIWNRRKNGLSYPEHLTISTVCDSQGNPHQYVALFSDISERKAMEEKVRQLAFYDSLTQLPNRRLLDDRLAQTMADSKRSGCYCALMFIDLDNFKPLNDLHGHAVGDLLLIEVARRLTSCVREVDTVARFGGDEFVVMLSRLDADRAVSIEHARVIAEKIRASVGVCFQLTLDGQPATTVEHHCSASIGVVVFTGHSADNHASPSQADIIKWADLAMYRAKDAGRNTIQFYDAS